MVHASAWAHACARPEHKARPCRGAHLSEEGAELGLPSPSRARLWPTRGCRGAGTGASACAGREEGGRMTEGAAVGGRTPPSWPAEATSCTWLGGCRTAPVHLGRAGCGWAWDRQGRSAGRRMVCWLQCGDCSVVTAVW